MSNAQTSPRLELQRARRRICASHVLLLVNFVLIVLPWSGGFVPSGLGLGAGLLYGLLCAACLLVPMQRVRDVVTRRSRRARMPRRFGGAQLVILVVLNLLAGLIAGADGLGSFYTTTFGTPADRIFHVVDVRLHPRSKRCYDHTLAELSRIQSFLNSHCLDPGYVPGSRLHYRGRESPFGFKEKQIEVETSEPPLHPPRRN